jgi:hypothetical protein
MADHHSEGMFQFHANDYSVSYEVPYFFEGCIHIYFNSLLLLIFEQTLRKATLLIPLLFSRKKRHEDITQSLSSLGVRLTLLCQMHTSPLRRCHTMRFVGSSVVYGSVTVGRVSTACLLGMCGNHGQLFGFS